MFAGKDGKAGTEAASDKGDAKGDKEPKKILR
jgi:hypothetical protein